MFFEATSPVTDDELSPEQIEELTNSVVDIYDVSPDDVTSKIAYVATGTMQLSVPEGTTEIEVVDAVVASLVELLDLHPRNVMITSVNLETVEVQYDNFSDPEDIEDAIKESLPLVEVDRNNVNADIEVDVTIVIDGSDADNIRDANDQVEDILKQPRI